MEFLYTGLLKYWYVIAALSLAVFIWRPDLRLRMLLAGLLVLPVVLIKPLIVSNYLAVFTKNGGLLGFWFPRVLLAISLGSFVVAVYEAILSKGISPAFHPSRPRLLMVLTGVLVFCFSRFLLNFDFINSLVVSLIVNLIIILVYERGLIWDLLFSAFGMSLIYLFIYLQTSFGFPGDFNNLSFSQEVIGVTLLSMPVEEILAVLLFGALFGPIYIALKDWQRRENQESNFSTEVLGVKVIFGRTFLVFAVITLVWLSNNFLLMPKVLAFESKVEAVTVSTKGLHFDFSRPVFRPSLKIVTVPEIKGSIYFENNILNNHMFKSVVFLPEQKLVPGQAYEITLTGISNIFGLGQDSFTQSIMVSGEKLVDGPLRDAQPTPDQQAQEPGDVEAPPEIPVTLLNLPNDYQDKPLSCEAAVLKMALGFRGVSVSEDEIMSIIGFDPTIRSGNVWGDPDVAFVGDINGKQNTTGYGVHWDPVARAANNFRPAQAFSNWQVGDLVAAVKQNNPVIIWGVIGKSYLDVWYTEVGREIKAWKGEHTFVVVGFKGEADNPLAFIINDPIAGRQTWSVEKLKSNWATFNNSGVVVY